MFYIIVILAAIFAMPAWAQSVDPYIGTWKLNLEKTTHIGQPVPKSETITYTGDGQNLAGTINFVGPQDATTTIKYTLIFDGQPHPTTGSPNFDSTAYIRFGNTINMVWFKNGKAMAVGQSRIDSDKQFTYTSEGIGANGQPFRVVLVWDRQ
jgi:hypothetical protein